MGFLWDLVQHSQINERKRHAESLEDRIAWLESELDATQKLLVEMARRLEERFDEDFDGDGRVG